MRFIISAFALLSALVIVDAANAQGRGGAPGAPAPVAPRPPVPLGTPSGNGTQTQPAQATPGQTQAPQSAPPTSTGVTPLQPAGAPPLSGPPVNPTGGAPINRTGGPTVNPTGGAPLNPAGGNANGLQMSPFILGTQPFFQDTSIQSTLGLTQDQLRQLNAVFGNASGQFQNQIPSIDRLTGQMRDNRLSAASRAFNNQMSQSLTGVLSQQQMQRFNQIAAQQQGFGLFLDPRVSQNFNLTSPQVTQFRNMAQEFNTQMQGIMTLAQTDPQQARTRFNDLMRISRIRMNTTLTPEQREQFHQLVGDLVDFTPAFLTQTPNGTQSPNGTQGGTNNGTPSGTPTPSRTPNRTAP